MNKRFYIVRHGEKIKRIDDPPLSDNGILQAKATGKYFKSFPIGKIISSPILRAKQAAGNRLQRLINCQDKKVNHVILITHGGIITDFLRNTFHSRTLNSAFKNFTIHMEENILECSITTIDFDLENQTSELLTLASTRHLRQL